MLYRINQGQSIDFFLLKHQNTILELKKYCIKLMEEALNCKEEENEEVKKQAENLVKKIKKELKNLKTGMAECQQISSNAYSNKKLEEAVLLSVKIYDLFEILYEN